MGSFSGDVCQMAPCAANTLVPHVWSGRLPRPVWSTYNVTALANRWYSDNSSLLLFPFPLPLPLVQFLQAAGAEAVADEDALLMFTPRASNWFSTHRNHLRFSCWLLPVAVRSIPTTLMYVACCCMPSAPGPHGQGGQWSTCL